METNISGTTQPKFVVVGTRISQELKSIEGGFEDHESSEVVATFSTKAKAQAYVDSARLKVTQRYKRVFKKRSLLSACAYAEIEEHFPEPPPPHDPAPL